MTVPTVRVPTVFTIVSPSYSNRLLGELVAYPDRNVDWDSKITLYSCGVPSWFDQWADAVGLPLKRIPCTELQEATLVPTEGDGKSLLILGCKSAGNNLADTLRLTRDKKANVIILDAAWLFPGRTTLKLRPGDFLGPLASLNTQTWAKPLSFSRLRIPNRILCNRWALAETFPIPSRNRAMPVLPLEVIGFLNAGFWVTVSGIPWQEQLGRREQADELLLEVLKAAATFAPKVETLRQGILLYPEKVVYDPKTMGYCPALACIAQNNDTVDAARVLIVDLRGDCSPPPDILDHLTAQVKNMGNQDRLLLIGDDPILDEWKWLKLDREKKIAHQPEVVWIEDDHPWDNTYEIPLMLKLTTLGVPLAPPEPQEK